jgi:thymidylate synthase (FAD)
MVKNGFTPEHHIADCARVSFKEGLVGERDGRMRSPVQDAKLIRYLHNHKHTSPSEMCNITFSITVPISIARQIFRHRTARFNEVSQRYTQTDGVLYSPLAAALNSSNIGFRMQANDNKQCSFRSKQTNMALISEMEDAEHLMMCMHKKYESLLKLGMARESARFYLPQATYTSFVMNIDLNNLQKFLTLRRAPDAQIETRIIANAMHDIAVQVFPITLSDCEEVSTDCKVCKERDLSDILIHDG